MRKHFNTTGLCFPEEHYMVNMESRLEKIKDMVDKGEYFAVNRARQYGKTTLLRLLAEKLSEDYAVFSISFEGMEDEIFGSAAEFCGRFCRLLCKYMLYHPISGIPVSLKSELKRMQSEKMDMEDLSDFVSELCVRSEKPVVLMIDEVDQAGNHKLFLTFLGMLRRKFLDRRAEPTFRSVILVGVHDIKNLKLRIRPAEEHQYNSPWNIAADFAVDMSFSAEDIAGMLAEYEEDTHMGMNITNMAELFYDYTFGYPFLVSRLCKIMDEQVPGKEGFPDLTSVWTKAGVLEAVKELLIESNTLFDDMVKKLDDFPELKQVLYRVLFKGESMPYNLDNFAVNLGVMFGFMKLAGSTVQITNRIFETRIYNLFISEELLSSDMYKAAAADKDRNCISSHNRIYAEL